MIVKLLPKHHLESLSLKGGCTGLSESTCVKMPQCLKLHVALIIEIHKLVLLQFHLLSSVFIDNALRRIRQRIVNDVKRCDYTIALCIQVGIQCQKHTHLYGAISNTLLVVYHIQFWSGIS